MCVCVYTDTWAAHARLSVPQPRLHRGRWSPPPPRLPPFLGALQAHRRRLVLSDGLLEVPCFCCCQAAAGGGRGLLVWGWRAAPLPLARQLQLRDGVEAVSPGPDSIEVHAPSHVATAIPGAATRKGHAIHLAFNSSLAAGTCFWVTVHTHTCGSN